MDNEKPSTDKPTSEIGATTSGRGMPKTAPFTPSPVAEPTPSPQPASGGPTGLARAGLPVTSEPVEPAERAGVFRQLVTDDGDIAGLVAYSIYKQNKLDWLTAFEKAKARSPNEDELGAYIIGEGTPRRLATYRHLAEATLAGNGPDVAGGSGQGARAVFRRGGFSDKTALTTSLLATYALIAILFLVGFLLAAHYTMSSR